MARTSKSPGGNWNAAGTWVEGAIPLDTDAVTITHPVTINDIYCVGDSLTINAGGDILPSTTSDSKLVLKKGITQANSASALVTVDMSSYPQYTFTLSINTDQAGTNSNTNVWIQGGPYTLKGADKKNVTQTDGALTANTSTQCYVDDATGWRVGDKIVFAATQDCKLAKNITALSYSSGALWVTATGHGVVVGEDVCLVDVTNTFYNLKVWKVTEVVNANQFKIAMGSPGAVTDQSGFACPVPKSEPVSIATITFDNAPTNTGRALFTWTDGIGTGGSVVHDHADGCPAANYTRNIRFDPVVAGTKHSMVQQNNYTNRVMENVSMWYCNGYSGYPHGVVQQTNMGMVNCAFYECAYYFCGSSNAAASSSPRRRNNYHSSINGGSPFAHGNQSGLIGPEEDMVVTRLISTGYAIYVEWPFGYLINPWISGIGQSFSSASPNTGTVSVRTSDDYNGINGGAIWACPSVLAAGQGVAGVSAPVRLNETRIGLGPAGTTFQASNLQLAVTAGTCDIVFDNCPLYHTSGNRIAWNFPLGQELSLFSKNQDQDVHEIYKSPEVWLPSMQKVSGAGDVMRATSSIWMKWYNTAAAVHSRSLNALVVAGATVKFLAYAKKNATYGSSNRPTLRVYDRATEVGFATMTDSVDTWELLSLEVTNNTAYDKEYRVSIEGMGAANGAICWFSGIPFAPFITKCRHYGYLFDETSPTRTADPYMGVAETTADDYTGVTLNNSIRAITFAAGTADTMQKFYDYSRWWCCDDVSRDVPFVRAGTLFQLATNWKVTDPYYTNTLTWGGGTVEFTTTGNKTVSLSSTTVRMTATGGYDFSSSTLSGTINLRTDTGSRVVTVTVPTGTTYDTTGETGIEVIAPTNTLTVAGSVTLLGAEVRIYDYDNSPAGSYGTEIAGIESCVDATFSTPITSGNTVLIQIIKDGYVEFVQTYVMGSSATFTANLETDTYS